MTFLAFLAVDLLSVHCFFPRRQSSAGNFGKREKLHVDLVVRRKKQFTQEIVPRRCFLGRYTDDRPLLKNSLKDFLPVGWHASEKADGHTKVSWTVLQCVCVCSLALPQLGFIEMNGWTHCSVDRSWTVLQLLHQWAWRQTLPASSPIVFLQKLQYLLTAR